jgi:hypothetical protein
MAALLGGNAAAGNCGLGVVQIAALADLTGLWIDLDRERVRFWRGDDDPTINLV